jgi:hypothetical protein
MKAQVQQITAAARDFVAAPVVSKTATLDRRFINAPGVRKDSKLTPKKKPNHA